MEWLIIVVLACTIALSIYGIIRYIQYSNIRQSAKVSPHSPAASAGQSSATLLNNRYELMKQIARGGMSDLYLAQDHRTKTQCVIKIPRHDTEYIPAINFEKLHIEAEYLRRLNHPNILRFIDLFTRDYTPHLVVEYIEGKDLRESCEDTPASEDVALSQAVQILDATDHMHRRGIIHRDLNPSNIMLRRDNSIAIIDFGTAKSTGNSEATSATTGKGTIIFKPGFEIPEQVRDGHADQRSDLYAIGNTLFFILTGRRPPGWMHPRDIADELMQQRVSERTARGIAQAMNIEPDYRFKDARAMRRALGI